jgi:phage baseplate assembly protein W
MNDSSFLGTGWSFPPAFDHANHQLQLTAGAENINRSIELLMKTPRGSRSMLPNYGANLVSFLFSRIDAAARESIIQSVKRTLLDSEPRIDVGDVSVTVADDGATVEIGIHYVIRQTNARHNHVIPFSVLEGTNLQGA